MLAKSDATRERLGTVLYTAAEGLRALAVLLSPVMPDATERLWEAIARRSGLPHRPADERGRRVGPAHPGQSHPAPGRAVPAHRDGRGDGVSPSRGAGGRAR